MSICLCPGDRCTFPNCPKPVPRMIEATFHPAEHVFDPFLNLSAECQAERWVVRRLAAAGFEIERAGPLGGPDVLAGRWSREELPGGAWRFRQWPAENYAVFAAIGARIEERVGL